MSARIRYDLWDPATASIVGGFNYLLLTKVGTTLVHNLVQIGHSWFQKNNTIVYITINVLNSSVGLPHNPIYYMVAMYMGQNSKDCLGHTVCLSYSVRETHALKLLVYSVYADVHVRGAWSSAVIEAVERC